MTEREYELVLRAFGVIDSYEAYHFGCTVKDGRDYYGVPVHEIKIEKDPPEEIPDDYSI